MDDRVYELLNDQINKELYSAYLYLSFADYYDEEGLSGFCNWYEIQAQEERDHALIFRNYLHDNGCKVKLLAIDQPDKTFTNYLEPLEAALEHEKYVTALINDIYAAAHEAKDYRTMKFLDWFIEEQMEEEDAHEAVRIGRQGALRPGPGVCRPHLCGAEPSGDGGIAFRLGRCPGLQRASAWYMGRGMRTGDACHRVR